MQYGYDMAKRHGPGFRRNVRFDDPAMSFCIDVLIPGSNNNKWITVPYERAREDRKSKQMEETKRHGSDLSSQGKTMPTDAEMSNDDNINASEAAGTSQNAEGAGPSAQPGFSFEKRAWQTTRA